MNSDGVLMLRDAIIMQAIKDYKKILKKIDDGKNDHKNDPSTYKTELTDRQKQVFNLRNEGLSCMEISKKLGCRVSNIYQIIGRTNKRMRKFIVSKGYIEYSKRRDWSEFNDIQKFFFSKWFSWLCDIEPNKILDHIENEYEKFKK